MAKSILKKILKLGGVSISRHQKEFETYEALFKKYSNFTMVPPVQFVFNLDLVRNFETLAGDYVECGVWRGGMTAAIAESASHRRRFHLFDSFEGLPPAKEIDGQEALAWQRNVSSPGYFNNCTAEENFCIQAMQMAGHDNYRIYKGWFNETLAQYEKRPIAILRLDGDWYDSIKVCLEELFPLVVPGGIVILDDYFTWDGCTRAVHDYLSQNQNPSRIHQWKNNVGYLVKKG